MIRNTAEIRPANKRWGIVVGVDDYLNAGEHLHNLRGCVADARRMFQTMTDKECCGFAEDHVVKLENPTYAEIESAFEKVGEKMKRGDELWFYYAGHGYSERRRNGVSGYLLPSDVKLNENGKLSTHGCISHSGLRDDFIARNIAHGNITVVMFLDCCCAGSVGLADGSRGAGADAQEVSDGFTESFRDLSLQGSAESEDWDFKYISFMATGKSGKAKEDASGGDFTKFLIEGLRGGRSDCPTVGPNATDVYIRAGDLGRFLGYYVPGQAPLQDFSDMRYPLSMSSERRLLQEKMQQMNKHVTDWLHKMREESLLEPDAWRFADVISDESESRDFKFAGMMRNLMRLFSDPARKLPIGLKEGAELIKAFYELNNLLENKVSKGAECHGDLEAQPRDTSVAQKEGTLLTRHDKELLEDVAERLQEVDGMTVDFPDMRRMTQAEAVAALDAIALRRMRVQRGRKHCDALYTSNEQAKWDNLAKKGFTSSVESAVRQLMLDDQALSQRRK